MQTFLKGRRVGYWLSEKKMKKLNFQAFADLCRKRGIEVVQLDLSQPLEEQGPLDVIIHKLTDLILEADQNDTQSVLLVQRVQDYIEAHPETIVLDPLPAIRTLLDRCKSYQLIHRIEDCMQDERICSPPFMVLNTECGPDTLEKIEKHGLTFPFICKTRVAHGTNSHEMAIIFSEEDLKDVKPPCVIQSFINHNAVLYKVFVVGESYTLVERPSLKNFPAGPADRKAIFFNSHNVSKPESSSDLTSRDNVEGVSQPPSDDVIRELSRSLRQALGVSLFGIDVIINNLTGQHAVIDINAFPGYEGVPEFFNNLLTHITSVLQAHSPDSPPASGQPKSLASSHTPSATVPTAPTPDSPGCCSMLGKEASSSPWIVEGDGNLKGPRQRLGCNSAMSPNFQQHCVSTIATKASSQ
ncbi:inositol-tetrakisphosphate 1-kinase [Salmo salar]|uniref:Inositol-tetrakisphosphate 1-kinase n=1 Tax=Salmo salar TaxID=8030 RepID=A0A1S3QW36_SALSA|nr:inositol-tetrakisphosphate 1-kinase-like [Salmo salar]XP_014043907.1 inositol-tetrakisphosphate 1-kinase-like [Salmo salar]XP_014043947.1 inositol-tetrakisphosphate 1-kinase-like [Salmo salar]XP_029585966.1 inositol-tetrakisphosphate 1-kinase-like [Salmo trutta]XP_029585967.1 inositol-tetrakisphosphate 1-kinase-like [Salmo trutta]XP_045572302.1 inositol-tetrakisphosphate 1-kinase-like [Salmo salar]|eukprot:XP_014043872.1 PREDICTED: inositol-tetrakisphosphate 1-kinase-like [Salmo salar]